MQIQRISSTYNLLEKMFPKVFVSGRSVCLRKMWGVILIISLPTGALAVLQGPKPPRTALDWQLLREQGGGQREKFPHADFWMSHNINCVEKAFEIKLFFLFFVLKRNLGAYTSKYASLFVRVVWIVPFPCRKSTQTHVGSGSLHT